MNESGVYLLDTHCLYWYLIDSPRLSARAVEIYAEGQAGKAVLVVHYIVLAELYYLLQKHKRTELFSPLLEQLGTLPHFRIEALGFAEIRELPAYPEVSEMHDRMLVIAANRLGATLVTRDSDIRESGRVSTSW